MPMPKPKKQADNLRKDIKILAKKFDALATQYGSLASSLESMSDSLREGLKPSRELESALAGSVKNISSDLSHRYLLLEENTQAQLTFFTKQMQELTGMFDTLLKRKIIQPSPEEHHTYISRSESVTSSKAFYADVVKTLGREGRYGYIASDDGTINMRLNEEENVALNASEVYRIRVEQNFKVKDIRITTSSASALGFRLFIA